MKLALITGVNGALGGAYLERFANTPGFTCVAVSRSKVPLKKRNVIKVEGTDLLDSENVNKEIQRKVPLDKATELFFIHPVGKFKFELMRKPEIDLDKDGIDDEVLSSNTDTFTNVEGPLEYYLRQIGRDVDVLLCAFGSVSDRYKVPFWRSYSKSKDILRQIISTKSRQNGIGPNFKGVFINVSSVNTGNENKLRPYADKTHWLEPEEIVDDSFAILFQRRVRNLEMDIFKPIPGFDPHEYYSSKNIRERWLREMGMKQDRK